MSQDIPINKVPPPKRYAIFTVRVPLREPDQQLPDARISHIGGVLRDAVYYLKEVHQNKQVVVEFTRIETPKQAKP